MSEEIPEALKERTKQVEAQMEDKLGKDGLALRVNALKRVGKGLSEQDLRDPQLVSNFDFHSKEALLAVASLSEDRGEARAASEEYSRIRQKEREAWLASKRRSR
jgi:hypothetical protein